jgi:hypothetical protein
MYLSLRVAENDGLGDRKGVVEVAQCVELPLLTLHCHEELLNTLKEFTWIS